MMVGVVFEVGNDPIESVHRGIKVSMILFGSLTGFAFVWEYA